MRIGLMLRSADEKGGIGVYTRNITRELIAAGKDHEFVLFYRNPRNTGSFEGSERVRELLVEAPGKLLWDQVAIPRACRRERVDVLFNPKFSVPLISPCPTAMVLHGAGWFIPEVRRFWTPAQLAYARLMMPLYCRRAAAVLSVSEITTRVFNEALGLPAGKIETVYLAPGRGFHKVEESAALARVREKYGLPESFILTLSGYDRGPRKNIDIILEAFRQCRSRTAQKLVVAGKDCERFRSEIDPGDPTIWDDVVFPGWVDQADLPAVYSQAAVFLYPSNMEAFPIPVTEALACGVPIVTSNAYGLREVAGEAAILVDPQDPSQVAQALTDLLGDSALREKMAARSLERAAAFTWDRCAGRTLEILESVAAVPT